MTVLFPKWTNNIPTAAAVGAVVSLGLAVLVVTHYFSPRNTDVGYAPDQPVPYSHKLHAGLMGFDCRYCHQKVEDGPHATVPPTQTCMNCHQGNRVKGDSPRLEVVRNAAASGEPIEWVKVHLLPDYVYFDHSVHVNAGVGCASCHGRIDQMEVVRQVEPLSMSWCLECHMDPADHLRPVSEVTNMDYGLDTPSNPNAAQEAAELGAQLVAEKNINPPIHCSACHR